MVNTIVSALNRAVAFLPVGERHGMVQVIDGVPAAHNGAGEYAPVVDDGAGGVSYWRLSGQPTIAPVSGLVGCPTAMRFTVPLTLVAFVLRELCDDPAAMAFRAGQAVTMAMAGVHREITGAFRSSADGVTAGVDVVRTTEVKGFAVPSHLAVLSVSVRAVVHGDASCMDHCEVAPSGPCPPATVAVNGVGLPDAAPGSHVAIQVLQGGEPVGDVNSETGVVTVPECDPATISINGDLVATVPSGDAEDIPVVNTNDNPVGTWDGNKWVVPDGEVRRTNGQPLLGGWYVRSGEQRNLPQGVISYRDKTNAGSITSPGNTRDEGTYVTIDTVPQRRQYTVNGAGTGAYADLTDLINPGNIRQIIIEDAGGNPVTPDNVDTSDPDELVITVPAGGGTPVLLFSLAPLDAYSLGDDPDGITITAEMAQNYTTITDDGGSGTWRYRINGGGWTSVGASLDLSGYTGDVIQVDRGTWAAAGWLRLEA